MVGRATRGISGERAPHARRPAGPKLRRPSTALSQPVRGIMSCYGACAFRGLIRKDDHRSRRCLRRQRSQCAGGRNRASKGLRATVRQSYNVGFQRGLKLSQILSVRLAGYRRNPPLLHCITQVSSRGDVGRANRSRATAEERNCFGHGSKLRPFLRLPIPAAYLQSRPNAFGDDPGHGSRV
jgi:hypothetical protein